eukprot:TRINITY_DN6292_c0_g1_i2.p1 TRINITY_DN6292_c0_g1~~TRINITY_DN6292_c0_g1_i2.p1  ORF type:complete len:354 (+),score=66.73 TRINITY_DN6292_c0_g1_i2:151-1212(+)
MASSSRESPKLLRAERGAVNATSRTPLLANEQPTWRPKVHDTCPTCKGKGKIQRDALNDNELVALIPLGDKRLKPRRTKTIVLSTVLLTACVLGFIIFFLYPRPVSIEVKSGSAANLSVTCGNQDGSCLQYFNMSIYWTLHVRNNNYMAVSVKGGNLIMRGVGANVMGNMSVALDPIPHRHSGDVILLVNASTLSQWAYRIMHSCVTAKTSPSNRIAVEFKLNLTVTIMSFHEPIVVNTLVPVTCPIPEAPIQPASTLPPVTILPSNSTTQATGAASSTTPISTASSVISAGPSSTPFMQQSQPSSAIQPVVRAWVTEEHPIVDTVHACTRQSRWHDDPRTANCTQANWIPCQ